ncbi:MAG: biotin/lipoyl-containing protein [Clostridiales bacterium]|nr:biotin/lipoyl-containing protein [Clostridiales bacterium]
MSTEVIMPKIGYTMEEGIIERWYKKVGDLVEAGEALLEISSDKATIEIDSPAAGYLNEILAVEGDTVSVLQVIAYINEITK